MKQIKNYKKISDKLASEAEVEENAVFNEARKLLESLLIESIGGLKKLMRDKDNFVKLGAIKQIQRVAGLEIQKIEHSGSALTLVVERYDKKNSAD